MTVPQLSSVSEVSALIGSLGENISKLIGSVVAVMLLLPTAKPDRERFARNKAVEAYEVRPGILMMPSYSADGQVCEMGLEKLHYSHNLIRLDSELSRTDIDSIFEELVPEDERGPKPQNPLAQGMDNLTGNSMVSDEEYEKVTIQVYGKLSAVGADDKRSLEEVTATLKWKNRKCQ